MRYVFANPELGLLGASGVSQSACILGLVHPRSGLFAETSLLCLCEITLRVLSFGVVSSPALDLNWRETSIRFSVWLEHAWALGILLSLWMRLLLSFPVVAWHKALHLGYFVYLLPFLTLCIATVLIS